MLKNIVILLVLIISLMCAACGTTSTELVISNANGIEVEYQDGKLIFVDSLSDMNIYPSGYGGCTLTPTSDVSFDEDTVISCYAKIICDDKHSDVINLCRDPICDHKKENTCIHSYGLIRNGIIVEDYIYFRDTLGIYRYSMNTLTTEPYAVFNKQVMSQFRMGKYLYICVDYGVFIKVDLTNDQAVVLSIEQLEYGMIYPYEGALYCLDGVSGIWRCDQNFDNAELIVPARSFDCHIPYSYQIYENKLYYVSIEDKTQYLYAYDLSDNNVEWRIPDVYCFNIYDGILYTQLYDPQDGPEFLNSKGNIVTTVAQTGGKIYMSLLSDPDSFRILCELDESEKRLDGYFVYATDRYIYAEVAEFSNLKINTCLYRYDMECNLWQKIGNGVYTE